VAAGWIITNPPYGARLGEKRALRNLYAQLGNVMRRSLPGWRVAMLSADRMLEGQVGLEWRELARTENGGLPVRLVAAAVGPG
jgi:putative N6-adenine-specific DNA methylase